VDYAPNGEKGLQKINEKKPDVLILDIKMPVKDGREVYQEIVEKNFKIPVIIFFDAISGEEIYGIRRIGKPAIVEKGSHQSHLAELVALIKKKAYFG
jgi:chemotaxis family two-component system response regulator PixH